MKKHFSRKVLSFLLVAMMIVPAIFAAMVFVSADKGLVDLEAAMAAGVGDSIDNAAVKLSVSVSEPKKISLQVGTEKQTVNIPGLGDIQVDVPAYGEEFDGVLVEIRIAELNGESKGLAEAYLHYDPAAVTLATPLLESGAGLNPYAVYQSAPASWDSKYADCLVKVVEDGVISLNASCLSANSAALTDATKDEYVLQVAFTLNEGTELTGFYVPNSDKLAMGATADKNDALAGIGDYAILDIRSSVEPVEPPVNADIVKDAVAGTQTSDAYGYVGYYINDTGADREMSNDIMNVRYQFVLIFNAEGKLIEVGNNLVANNPSFQGTYTLPAGGMVVAFNYNEALGNTANKDLYDMMTEALGGKVIYNCTEAVVSDVTAVAIDGKLYISLHGEPVVEPDPLPADAISLGYLGCNYAADVSFIIAGDNKNVGELTTATFGSSKDLNFFYLYVVDADNKVVGVYETLGRPDGVKTDVVCPEGGYILAIHGNLAKPEVALGNVVTLYNVDLDAVRALTEFVEANQAGFTVAEYLEPLPADAISLGYLGCNYATDVTFIIAGDNKTVGELVEATYGSSKDLNFFYLYVVGADNTVVGVYETLGRPDGVKTDVVCPEGGYIIAIHGNLAKPEISVGDEITLYNVDLDAVRALTSYVEAEQAGFTVTAGDPVVEQNFLEIGVNEGVTVSGWGSDYYVFATVEGTYTIVGNENLVVGVVNVYGDIDFEHNYAVAENAFETLHFILATKDWEDAVMDITVEYSEDIPAPDTYYLDPGLNEGVFVPGYGGAYYSVYALIPGVYTVSGEGVVVGVVTEYGVDFETNSLVAESAFQNLIFFMYGENLEDVVTDITVEVTELPVVEIPELIVGLNKDVAVGAWGTEYFVFAQEIGAYYVSGEGVIVGFINENGDVDYEITYAVADHAYQNIYFILATPDFEDVVVDITVTVGDIPTVLDPLPENAIVIDRLGYEHVGGLVQLIAGDGKTVGDLCGGKDMNANYLIVVDASNTVVAVYDTFGRPDGVKTDVVCPDGGYMIGIHQDRWNGNAHIEAAVGGVITLYNIDLLAVRELTSFVVPEGAGFTYVAPIPENAIAIGHIGYPHGNATAAIIMAGDNMTIGQIVENTYGQSKDPVWWTMLIVNSDNIVTDVLANGDSKADVVCPEGSYILGVWSSTEAIFPLFGNISVGDSITLYNIDLDAVRACDGYYVPMNAGFTYASNAPVDTRDNLVLGMDTGLTGYGNYNANLTDGVALENVSYTKDDWFAFHASNTVNNVGTIDFALGSLCEFNEVRVNTFLGNASGIAAPKYIKVEISEDGISYTTIGLQEFAKPESGTETGWVVFALDSAVEARYVRISMEIQAAFAFINEIQVLGNKLPEPEPADLIPVVSPEEWGYTEAGGYQATVEYVDGALIVSADGAWPKVEYTYPEFITVNIEKYVLKYDFTVEHGATNISFLFGNVGFPISNTALGVTSYDPGSGDLQAGHYAGQIRLTDLVNSKQNYNGAAFPIEALDGNKLTFTGIQIYSVSGATVTVNELKLDLYTEPTPPAYPEGATVIDRLGYEHTAGLVQLIAGNNKTIGGLCGGKDMNANYVIVVNATGTVVGVYDTFGRPDGVKTDVVCPNGGYIIGIHQDRYNSDANVSVKVGDSVELYNVDLDAVRAAESYTDVTGGICAFVIVPASESKGSNIESVGLDTGIWQNAGDTDPRPEINAGYTVSSDANNFYIHVTVDRPWEYKDATYQTGATNFRIWVLGDLDYGTESKRQFFDVTLAEDGSLICYLAKQPASVGQIKAIADTSAESIDVTFVISKATINAVNDLKLMVSYSSPYVAEEGKDTKYNCFHITEAEALLGGWSGNASMYKEISFTKAASIENEQMTVVDGSEVGTWQGNASETLGYSYAWDVVDGKLIVHGILTDTGLVNSSIRIWLHNGDPEATLYTHFIDLDLSGSMIDPRIMYNTEKTTNKAAALAAKGEAQPYTYSYIISEGKLEFTVSLPLSVIGASDAVEAIMYARNNGYTLYTSKEIKPYATWLDASIVYPVPSIDSGKPNYAGVEVEVASGNNLETIHDSNPVGNYTGSLTDGIVGTTAFDSKWFGWTFNITPKPAYTSVVIDLGSVKSDISSIGANIWAAGSAGIGVPSTIEILGSKDGIHFNSVGVLDGFTANGPAWYSLRPENLLEIRYVKFVVYPPQDGTGVFVFMSEVSVKQLDASAIPLDNAGYVHGNVSQIVAGGGQTIGDITARTQGSAKDANAFYAVAVDRAGRVVEVNYTIGRPDGVKTDMVCPAGGYILLVNAYHSAWSDAQKDAYAETIKSIKVGATVTLHGVSKLDLAYARTGDGNISLENAYFTFDNSTVGVEPIEATVNVSHVNLYSWGAFDSMVITGEGRNCNDIGYNCLWWNAIKVDLIDGEYVVTGIEKSGETKAMTASANGFIVYTFSNKQDQLDAALTVTVGMYADVNVNLGANVASETAVGSITFYNMKAIDPNVPAIGDLTADGRIGADDVTAMLKGLVGIEGAADISAIDLDGNGAVDIYDAVLMLRYALGVINEFPVE